MNREEIYNLVNMMSEYFNLGKVSPEDKESIVSQACFLSKFISIYNGSVEYKLQSTQVLSYITYNELIRMGYKLTTFEEI